MRRLLTAISLSLLLLVTACSQGDSSADYDIIIRGGDVYDGLGNEAVTADIGIIGDRIEALGDLSAASATTEIDALGLAVAPGFINMLSWATETLIEDGRAMSDIMQGVTLEVMGEGSSMGPLNEDMKARLRQRQGDIRYDIEWTTLGQYLEYLEARGVSVNVA